jgi:hypothetical protein
MGTPSGGAIKYPFCSYRTTHTSCDARLCVQTPLPTARQAYVASSLPLPVVVPMGSPITAVEEATERNAFLCVTLAAESADGLAGYLTNRRAKVCCEQSEQA